VAGHRAGLAARGLAGSLALALPWGDFHPFVKWLIVGLTFTNLLGLLASGIALAYRQCSIAWESRCA